MKNLITRSRLNLLFSSIVLLAGLLHLGKVRAEDIAPDALVKNVTNEVLTIVRNDPDIKNGNTKKAIELVDAKVLPHFNFSHMTSLAVGKDWNKATPAQKQTLTGEFRTLLVRTYSNALTSYRNQTINFKPFSLAAGATEAVVKTEVRQPGGSPIGINYWLEKTDSGWKVYDIAVDGISLITNYRDEFGQTVRSGGIDGLIASLVAKNKAPLPAKK